ncbi:helix-turn-helix domain-containing protein [Micromonospora aurantiaca (nom. illeg.)]|uniref:helix-turn-helix domain-containing protein n=1 Tax=Micromonospora aurantiaca (nom. illeg.) TaxID=47850 RepID=UPI0033FA4103
MVEALAEQHMGRVVRAYRCHPWHGRTPLPQELVGDWLQLKQSQVSKLESGRPRKHLDWLKFVARTLRIPAEVLWFKLDGNKGGGAGVVPTIAPRVPNELLRRARLARVSPSGSGRVLSRQELAEAVNAWVLTTYQRRVSVSGRSIGNLERGDTRWPAEWVRAGLRAVLDVETDAEIGLYIIQNFALPAAATDQAAPDALPPASEPAALPTAPVNWDMVTDARRELGRLLAGWRQRTGLTQRALSEQVRWARSTVANVECGQEVRRSFWEGCDKAVGARGALLAAADHVSDLADRCRAQETDEGMRQCSAALATRTSEPDGTGAGVVESDAVGVGSVPTVHVTVSAGASVTLGFGGGGTVGGQPVRVVVTAADEEPRDLDWPAADGARVYSLAAWRGRQ